MKPPDGTAAVVVTVIVRPDAAKFVPRFAVSTVIGIGDQPSVIGWPVSWITLPDCVSSEQPVDTP